MRYIYEFLWAAALKTTPFVSKYKTFNVLYFDAEGVHYRVHVFVYNIYANITCLEFVAKYPYMLGLLL